MSYSVIKHDKGTPKGWRLLFRSNYKDNVSDFVYDGTPVELRLESRISGTNNFQLQLEMVCPLLSSMKGTCLLLWFRSPLPSKRPDVPTQVNLVVEKKKRPTSLSGPSLT